MEGDYGPLEEGGPNPHIKGPPEGRGVFPGPYWGLWVGWVPPMRKTGPKFSINLGRKKGLKVRPNGG